MIYRLLGEFVVLGPNGRPVTLLEARFLRVFVALLINANHHVSKEDLLRAGWGVSEIDVQQLYKAISAIRGQLTTVGRPGLLVRQGSSGYELTVAGEDLDLLEFRQLLWQADEAGTRRATEEEIKSLRDALKLWRGRPWSNVPGDPFRGEVERLERQQRQAAIRLFELELGLGRYHGALDRLTAIANAHPTDRRLCELLMIALYRSGDRMGALATYDRHKRDLEAETSARPEPAIVRLHYAISAADEDTIAEFEASLPGRSVGLGPAVGVPRELPPAPAGFVGRDDLAAEAAWLLGRSDSVAKVLVISGPGGIGKTGLAIGIAHQNYARYPDGQLYVELHGTSGAPVDDFEVLGQILRALRVQTVPETKAERVSTYRTLLADRRVLVVLDDARDEAQVRDLIPGSASCAVLITARRRLPDVNGAHHLPPLKPLQSDPAMKLFQHVVQAAQVDVDPHDEATKRVVALCAGLPLALCIAASLRVHEVGRPIAELADRLASQGPEAFQYGERSVAVSVGAGLERLDASARQLFLSFGLARLHDFSAWTAAALVDAGALDPVAAMSELIRTYLLQPGGTGAQYTLHELTREYAFRRAGSEFPAGARRDVPERTYRALLTLARRAHRNLYGGDFEVVHSGIVDWAAPTWVLEDVDRSAMDWFEAERRNIRSAVNHCAELGLTELCWDLAMTAHEFYAIAGYHDDWYTTNTVALEVCRTAGDLRGEGVMLAALGQPTLVASRPGGSVSGLPELQRAADLLAECGDRHGQAIALRSLANALRRRGQLHRPLALFEQALAYYRESGDRLGAQQTMRFIGQTHLDLGSYDEAARVLDLAGQLARDLGRDRLQAQNRYWLGQVHLAVGDLAAAEDDFEAVRAGVGEGQGLGAAYARHGRGEVALRGGDLGRAEEDLTMAAALARANADLVLEGRVCLSIAALRRGQRNQEQELEALNRAVASFAGCGSLYFEADAWVGVARVQEARGDGAAARAARAEVGRLYDEMDLPPEDQVLRPRPAGA